MLCASPTNGKGFTVTLPGAMGGIQVTAFDPLTGEAHVFDLGIGPGKMVLNFDFIMQGFPGGPPSFYRLTRGTFTTGVATPEPGPLGLMAAGLAGILGIALRKRKQPALKLT